MIAEHDFHDLMRRIVAEHLPDEELLFEVEGDDTISKLYAGKPVQHAVVGAELRAIDPHAVTQIVEYVSVVNSTYSFAATLIANIRTVLPAAQANPTSVSHRWETELVKAGLKPHTARAISQSFAKDLVRMISPK